MSEGLLEVSVTQMEQGIRIENLGGVVVGDTTSPSGVTGDGGWSESEPQLTMVGGP